MNNIFAKEEQQVPKLTLTSIIDSIPVPNYPVGQFEWEKNHATEWRWRILNIEGKEKVEISYLKNNKRIYYTKYGEWVERNISPVYDKYVEKEYYAYS